MQRRAKEEAKKSVEAEFVGEETCAVCGGTVQVWVFDGLLTFTHNGYTYKNGSALTRECFALKKAKELAKEAEA